MSFSHSSWLLLVCLCIFALDLFSCSADLDFLLQKNAAPRESMTLKKLNEYMLPKDPFYKPPLSPEGEAA